MLVTLHKKVSAKAIVSGIFDFLSANHKEKNTIIAIRCDGTVVNTGVKGGALRMIELDVVNFEPILFDLPDMNQSDPSINQPYLYDIHRCVCAEKSIEGLANKSLGKIAHSRWLTTASHIVRI